MQKKEYTQDYNFKRLSKEGETCWEDVIKRFINEMIKRGCKTPKEDLEWACLNFLVLPNSPALSTAGNDKFYASACSSYPIVDSMDDGEFSILNTLKISSMATKAGIGTGFNFSSLRSKEESVKGRNGTTGGPVSFLRAYNGFIREITQATRKSASMGLLHINHPDIEDYINCKVKDGDIENFNLSVVIDDKFMEAVEKDEDYELIYRNQSKVKKVKARELFDLMCKRMWENGEPGVMFADNIKKDYFENLCDCKILANPCLTGDTLIAVADGRNAVSIKNLCDTEFLVYSAQKRDKSNGNSFCREWKTEIKKAKAFYTGNKYTIRLILSNGDEVRCTEDHLIALRDGSYIEAKDSLNHIVERFYSSCDKYRTINSITDAHKRQYRLIWEYYNGQKPKGYSIDHKKPGISDHIDNLQLLKTDTHDKKTGNERLGKDNSIHLVSKEKRKWISSKSSRGEYNCKFSGITNEDLIYLGKRLYEDGLVVNKENLKSLDARVPMKWSKYRFNGDFNYYLNIVKGVDEYRPTEYLADPEPKIVKHFDHLTQEIEVIDIIPGTFEDVYDITVEDNHNFYIITNSFDLDYKETRGILVHNCSEALLSHGDDWLELCVLASINLPKYLELDKKDRQRVIDITVSMLNDIIDIQDYVTPLQERGMKYINRKIGIGVAGLATVLAKENIKYSSDDSYDFTKKIFKEIGGFAKDKSEQLFKERENSGWEQLETIAGGGKRRWFRNYIDSKSPLNMLKRLNASLLSVAPTSSLSNIFNDINEEGCSYGIEPYFTIDPYIIHNSFGDFEKKEKIVDIFGFEKAKAIIETANELEYKSHLKPVQAYYDANWGLGITQGCSKTLNFKNNVTVDEIKESVIYCWKNKIKAISFYRDGSRKGQVMVTKDSYKDCIELDSNGRPVDIFCHQSPKRPEFLECDIVHTICNKQSWLVLIGLYRGKPYEIFAGLEENISIPKKYKQGRIQKKKGYHLIVGEGDDELIIKDIPSSFKNPEFASLTRLVSFSLRHGGPLRFVVEQLQKEGGFDTFNKAVSRCLKKYISDNEDSKGNCPNCNGTMKYISGCPTCVGSEGKPGCGYSKCS